MYMFILLILSAYFSLWHEMSRLKWATDRTTNEINLDYPSLQKKTFLNKIICLSLKKREGQYQYVYYVKKGIIVLCILLIPWFFCVYLYEWYNVKQFVLIHLIVTICGFHAPTNVYRMIVAMYEKKKCNNG